MLVEVLYFAEFKDITKKDTEKFSLSNKSLKELINLLIAKYNNLHELLLDKKDLLSNNISVIVNNKSIHNQDALSTVLSEGDKIAFLLPVSGG